ncbi:MAG: hypothetical protein GY926_13070 [bacterium]|nr:hypothetical protein [bacterium]
MLDLEDQIRRVADAAFEQTSPVIVDLPPATRSGRTGLRIAMAAAAAVVIGGTAIAALRATDRLSTTDRQDLELVGESPEFDYRSRPLDLNLDEAIGLSTQERVSSIGPVLRFDLDALPEGWSAEQTFATTIGIPGRPSASYWQQVAVTLPDRTDLVLNISGPLSPNSIDPDLTLSIDGESIEVRGQPARVNRGHLQWIEQDQILVDLVRGPKSSPFGADVSDEMFTLASQLEPFVAQLAWDGGDEMATPVGPSRLDAVPLLSGALAGTAWRVAADGSDLQLLVGDQAQFVGNTGRTVPDDGEMIHYSVMPLAVPGGAIIFGRSPDTVKHVRLDLLNATVDLPIVAFDDQQIAFAVPISDLLDPVTLSFLGENETVLATIPLSNMPPYLGGAVGSSAAITSG